MGGPFHEEAVGNAAEHAQDPHGVGALHAAAIIIVRDVQSLVQPVFDTPTLTVELQPLFGGKRGGRCAGNEHDLFGFPALGLAEQAGDLACEGETDIFSTDRGSSNGTTLRSSLVFLLGPSLG